MSRLLWLIACCAMTGPAVASDKGLQSELNELTEQCFCKTSLAKDMGELMDGVRFLTRARMSQEALVAKQKEHDEMWAKIAKAHPEVEGFAGRLRNIDLEARHEMANIAWERAIKSCPKKVKGADASYLLEAWKRAGVVSMKDQVGKEVDFTGKAENAKGGAVVVVGGDVVYLEGVDSWPDDVFGKEVTVHGTLTYKKMIPDPDEGPEYSAGAYGKQYVLEDPKWE